MAWAPCSRAKRRWSIAGWPFSMLSGVASNKTSARAAVSHCRTLAHWRAEAGTSSSRSRPSSCRNGERPAGADAGDAPLDPARAQFRFALREQLRERPVHVAEAEQAQVQRRNGGLRGLPNGVLTHGGRVFGLDLVDHADFPGLGIGILVNAQVFLGHFVDVLAGALLGDLGHAAANFEVAVRVLRVHDGQRDAGIAADIAILLAPLGGVEDDVLAVVVDPHGSDLGASVGHEGAEAGEGALLEKVGILFRDGRSHESLLGLAVQCWRL